jgi:hypothetical protein
MCKIYSTFGNDTVLIREPLFITPPTNNHSAVITVDVYKFTGDRYRYKYFVYSLDKGAYSNVCFNYDGKRVLCERLKRTADNVIFWTLGGATSFGFTPANIIISQVLYLDGFADNTQWEIIQPSTVTDTDWESYDGHAMTMCGFYENTYYIGSVYILAKGSTPPTDEQKYPMFRYMNWVKDTVMSNASTTMDYYIRLAPTSTEHPEYGMPTKSQAEEDYETANTPNPELPPIIS